MRLERVPWKLLVITVVGLMICAGSTLADGIFNGWIEVRTEHTGPGAPEHGTLWVRVPLTNWSKVPMVDVSETNGFACVRYVVTGLAISTNCQDADICWPIDESYDKGKVKVTVSRGDNGKKLTKMIAKYKDGDTGWVCKGFAAKLLAGAETVKFAARARGLASKDLKLFQDAAILQEEREGARMLPRFPQGVDRERRRP